MLWTREESCFLILNTEALLKVDQELSPKLKGEVDAPVKWLLLAHTVLGCDLKLLHSGSQLKNEMGQGKQLSSAHLDGKKLALWLFYMPEALVFRFAAGAMAWSGADRQFWGILTSVCIVVVGRSPGRSSSPGLIQAQLVQICARCHVWQAQGW